MPLAVHEWGGERDPAVLLWHGVGDEDALHLSPLAEVLADEFGLRVLAPDAPGYGGSPPLPRTASYHPAALARLALRLLERLGVERFAFVGYSWGAGIGCHAAADSGRVSALVLLDGGYTELADYERPRELARATEADWAVVGRQRAVRDPELWARAVHAAFAPPTVASVYPRLRRSGVPVLLLAADHPRGSEEGRPAERGRARFAAALPEADVRVLAGRGHDLPGEAGAEVARIAAEWLLALGA